MRPHSMRRILAPCWRAALRIAEHDGPRGIAIMGALSRLQYRARIGGGRNHSGP
jgi:hypothetical protein